MVLNVPQWNLMNGFFTFGVYMHILLGKDWKWRRHETDFLKQTWLMDSKGFCDCRTPFQSFELPFVPPSLQTVCKYIGNVLSSFSINGSFLKYEGTPSYHPCFPKFWVQKTMDSASLDYGNQKLTLPGAFNAAPTLRPVNSSELLLRMLMLLEGLASWRRQNKSSKILETRLDSEKSSQHWLYHIQVIEKLIPLDISSVKSHFRTGWKTGLCSNLFTIKWHFLKSSCPAITLIATGFPKKTINLNVRFQFSMFFSTSKTQLRLMDPLILQCSSPT